MNIPAINNGCVVRLVVQQLLSDPNCTEIDMDLTKLVGLYELIRNNQPTTNTMANLATNINGIIVQQTWPDRKAAALVTPPSPTHHHSINNISSRTLHNNKTIFVVAYFENCRDPDASTPQLEELKA
jgi:hypothetical protein